MEAEKSWSKDSHPNKARESRTGKGEISKAPLTCTVRGGVQICEERKGCPNARLDESGSAALGNHMSSLVPMTTGSTMPELSQKNGSSTGRLVGLQAGDRASMGWGAQETDGCPFFIRNVSETILVLLPGQLATADSASW